MNASTWRLELMIHYVTLFVHIGLLAKSWKNLRLVKNFELNLKLIFTKNPYLTVVIGDFNVKSQNWYKDDKITASGTKLEIKTSHYELTQNNYRANSHIRRCFIQYTSVIRQKGKSQNECFKKAKHAKISEKQTFLTP